MNGEKQYDVVIVGGGVVGAACAYFLTVNETFNGSVLVVEKDPSYGKCSTALSAGGFRQQFSIAENIRMSQFGYQFFKNVNHLLAVEGNTPYIAMNESGYLFLATGKGEAVLEENHHLQRSMGVDVALLPPSELKTRFPWLETEGLASGSLGAQEGWLDPYGLLQAFKKKSQSLGAIWTTDEVVSFELNLEEITRVGLSSGTRVLCGSVVNAAGPRARDIAALAGISLPVHPKKRMVYSFTCPHQTPGLPLMICPNGVYVRPEGRNWLCGVSPPADQDPDCLDLTPDDQLFYDCVWPTLAHRVPVFESLKLTGTWAGHYAYNVMDQNAIFGNHDSVKNLYFANGFSGHGLQQAPATGRAVSELIVHGEFSSLDLTAFLINRFKAGALIREQNVV